MREFLSGKRLFSPQTRSERMRGAVARALPFLFAASSVAAQAPELVPAPAPQLPLAPLLVPGQAPRALPQGIRIVELQGLITAKTVPSVRSALEDADPGRFPAGAIVLIDSPGGDGLAAIEIGRMVRAASAHVFVRGRCASACTYVLAGGVVRGVARDGAIGIHGPRLTTFVKGIGTVDVNAASNPRAAAALELGNRRSREYFSDMGLPDALFSEMLATPSGGIRYLDLAELPALGLAGFDPAYLAGRAPAAARVYRISGEEYARRTLTVPGLCLAVKGTADEFLRCYRRALRTGE